MLYAFIDQHLVFIINCAEGVRLMIYWASQPSSCATVQLIRELINRKYQNILFYTDEADWLSGEMLWNC